MKCVPQVFEVRITLDPLSTTHYQVVAWTSKHSYQTTWASPRPTDDEVRRGFQDDWSEGKMRNWEQLS
jgi:hypothetical protein